MNGDVVREDAADGITHNDAQGFVITALLGKGEHARRPIEIRVQEKVRVASDDEMLGSIPIVIDDPDWSALYASRDHHRVLTCLPNPDMGSQRTVHSGCAKGKFAPGRVERTGGLRCVDDYGEKEASPRFREFEPRKGRIVP